MRLIDAILNGSNFTEKLLGLKQRQINRALDAAKDDAEKQREDAEIAYDQCYYRLADDTLDFHLIINEMIEKRAIISAAENTIREIEKIKEALYAPLDDE